MPQTDDISVVTQAIVDKLLEPPSLGLADVWYGDQQKIPRTPAIAVESGSFSRDLSGAMERTDNTFTVSLFVYLAKVQDIQITRKENDALTKTIMDRVHSDLQLGGLVIHGFITSIEPGFALREGSMYRAARMTWQGLSKTSLIPA